MIILAIVFIALLILATGLLVHTYRHGNTQAVSLLYLFLLLFWSWLAVTIPLSAVTYLSQVNFWWVGSFVFVFILYNFIPDPDRFWQYCFTAILLCGVILAISGLVQHFYLNQLPNGSFLNRNTLAAMLNLLVFVLIGRFLLQPEPFRLFAGKYSLALATLFLFVFTIAITQGRAANLSFIISLVLLLTLVWKIAERKKLLYTASISIIAMLSANISIDFSLVARIATLQEIQTAGADRIAIWLPALEMLKDAPWYGIGLGTFWLAFPPYRSAIDHSAGFYAHNDYLQILIESGWPALMLLIAILIAVTSILVRTLRSAGQSAQARIESIALFCALLTIAMHSFFTYNLYVLPLMLLVGLYLARLNQLAGPRVALFTLSFSPGNYIRPKVFYTLLTTVFLAFCFYFSSLGLSEYYFKKARLLSDTAPPLAAHYAYEKTEIISQNIDVHYYAHAQHLQRYIKTFNPATQQKEKQSITKYAHALLDNAIAINPYRPETYYIRGLLYESASKADIKGAIEQYLIALEKNPRFLPARVSLMKHFAKTDKARAKHFAAAGLKYMYQLDQYLLDYYSLGLELFDKQKDAGIYQAIRKQLAMAKQALPAETKPVIKDR